MKRGALKTLLDFFIVTSFIYGFFCSRTREDKVSHFAAPLSNHFRWLRLSGNIDDPGPLFGRILSWKGLREHGALTFKNVPEIKILLDVFCSEPKTSGGRDRNPRQWVSKAATATSFNPVSPPREYQTSFLRVGDR